MTALLANTTVAARTQEDDAAIARGHQALAWAQAFACPDMGHPLSVAGLSTTDEISHARQENWAFANSRLASMAEAIRARRVIEAEIAAQGGKPSRSMQESFAALDDSIAATSARTTSALAQWMLASWVEMSRLDGGVDLVGGGPHPLAPYAADGRKLEELAQGFGGALTPLVEKYNRCLGLLQASLIEYNSAQIAAAAEAARTPAALDRIVTALEVTPSPSGSAGGQIIADLKTRRDALALAEAEAEQRRRAAASAELRARLEREASAGRAIAARYVAAINSGDLNGGIALLHDHVRLVSPRDSATGKQAVAARMRDAARDDQGVRPQPPQIDSNYQVFSTIRSTRGSGKMYFSFSGGKIEQIRLVQD
ncbi:hypothetical protein [Sphingobium sp. B2]|uniref:hypothetical protein n=1 Tax=Sphingobium sp. B2 TaxID=2583228 RepID=UPI0011A5DAFE|nr:hypothetical protein [Sphingobium sp. B2]